jgi:hypothetical protein
MRRERLDIRAGLVNCAGEVKRFADMVEAQGVKERKVAGGARASHVAMGV